MVAIGRSLLSQLVESWMNKCKYMQVQNWRTDIRQHCYKQTEVSDYNIYLIIMRCFFEIVILQYKCFKDIQRKIYKLHLFLNWHSKKYTAWGIILNHVYENATLERISPIMQCCRHALSLVTNFTLIGYSKTVWCNV